MTDKVPSSASDSSPSSANMNSEDRPCFLAFVYDGSKDQYLLKDDSMKERLLKKYLGRYFVVTNNVDTVCGVFDENAKLGDYMTDMYFTNIYNVTENDEWILTDESPRWIKKIITMHFASKPLTYKEVKNVEEFGPVEPSKRSDGIGYETPNSSGSPKLNELKAKLCDDAIIKESFKGATLNEDAFFDMIRYILMSNFNLEIKTPIVDEDYLKGKYYIAKQVRSNYVLAFYGGEIVDGIMVVPEKAYHIRKKNIWEQFFEQTIAPKKKVGQYILNNIMICDEPNVGYLEASNKLMLRQTTWPFFPNMKGGLSLRHRLDDRTIKSTKKVNHAELIPHYQIDNLDIKIEESTCLFNFLIGEIDKILPGYCDIKSIKHKYKK